MAKISGDTSCIARPQPLREDAELLGGTHAFDCSSASSAESAVLAFKQAAPKLETLLLFNAHTLPFPELLGCIAAAKKLFRGVKVELDPRGMPAPRSIARIAAAADVLILCAPANTAGSLFSCYENILSGKTSAGAIILKIALPKTADARTAAKLLADAGRSGAKHVVLTIGNISQAAEKACLDAAERFDMTVELAAPQASRAWRGRSARMAEAKSLLLDIPFCRAGGKAVPLGAVFQLSFNCNQRCVFCTSENTLPAPPREFARQTLRRVLADVTPRVVFTGGEPTLEKALPGYVSMCRDAGVPEISVYTNGMAFASKAYARKLRGAGMDAALVSLHSARADVSDAITRCPGGFDKTAKGISNILDSGAAVVINYVVCAQNYRETPGFIAFAHERFPGAAVNFSFIAPILGSAARKSIVPKFSAAAPFIIRALDEADRLGVSAAGLEPHLGIPPCALDADPRYFPFLLPLSEPFSGFVKSPVCADCRCDKACPGVRKNYAALHGLGELRPIKGTSAGRRAK